jgi:hypothetical protein
MLDHRPDKKLSSRAAEHSDALARTSLDGGKSSQLTGCEGWLGSPRH